MSAPNSSPDDDKAANCDAANLNSLEQQADRSHKPLNMPSMVSVEVKEKQHATFDNHGPIPDPESLAAEPPRGCESHKAPQPPTPSSIAAPTTTGASLDEGAPSKGKDINSTPQEQKTQPQLQKKPTVGIGRSKIHGTLGSLMGRINSLDNKLEDLRIPQPEPKHIPKSEVGRSAEEAEDNEAAAIFKSLVSRMGNAIAKDSSMPRPSRSSTSQCSSQHILGTHQKRQPGIPQFGPSNEAHQMSRIIKGCESTSVEPQKTADHLMLQMVAELEATAQGEYSQGTSLMSGNTSEWPQDFEVQSRSKKLRATPSMSSQATSEATGMSSHGFEASLQKAQSSAPPPPEFEYDHSKGNDKSAQEMLRSMKQAAIGLQKARDMDANQSPQSDSSFSFDNDNGHLAAEDMQEIVSSYLAQISGCLKNKKTDSGMATAAGERNASIIQSRQESLQNRLETGHEPLSGVGLAKQQAIMHPMGDDIGSHAGACCQALPAGEAMDIDFMEGWASDLALEDVNSLDLENLM